MAFVPIIPHLGTSDRAQELARELDVTVERFRSRNPELTAFEVRQALRLVRRNSDLPARKLFVAIAIGLVAALGIALQAQRHVAPAVERGPQATMWILPSIVLAVLVLGVLALVISRR